MRHNKKIHPKFFGLILNGKKTFELRLADWECNEGDILVLQEWDPEKNEYTGRQIEKVITYISKTKNINHWSKEEIEKYGFQIISFK